MATSGQDSSPPPAGGRPPRKPRSFTPLAAMRAQVHEGAKELVVDEFVDAYFQERPKTLPPMSPKGAAAPPPPTEAPSGPSRAAHVVEESGVRKAATLAGQVATIEVSIPEHEDLVVMEAELADRDEKISSLEDELLRLRGEIGTLQSTRGVDQVLALADPVVPPAPQAPPVAAPIVPATRAIPTAEPTAAPRRARSTAQMALGGLLAVAAIATALLGVTRRAPREAERSAQVEELPTAERVPKPEPPKPEPAQPEPPKPEPPKPEPPKPEPPKPEPPRPEPSAGDLLSPPPSDAPPATSAAGPSPSAEPSARPSADAAAASTDPAPTLLSFQALLTVTSSVDAEVVVQGQSVGRTNQRLLTRCGPRNVRLRRDGAWLSPGEHVRIVCMEHTQIRVDPTK